MKETSSIKCELVSFFNLLVQALRHFVIGWTKLSFVYAANSGVNVPFTTGLAQTIYFFNALVNQVDFALKIQGISPEYDILLSNTLRYSRTFSKSLLLLLPSSHDELPTWA